MVSSDTTLTYAQLKTLYQKWWAVEVFHQSLKQNGALERSPTKTFRSQSNHIFAAMLAFVKLECLKLSHHSNHFALKSNFYLKAVQAAFLHLQSLKHPYF